MKIVWEVSDITPGRLVGSPLHSERFKIGYGCMRPSLGQSWHLVSMLDGMISAPEDKASLAKELNEYGYWPSEWLDT